MSEASTKLNIKNITYALFFLGTLLICFIQSGYLTLTALRHMILEFGRNLTFFARKLGVNLIFFSGIYLNPEKDLVIWLMVKKKTNTKKLPEVEILLSMFAFHMDQLNENYTVSTVPSVQGPLST